MSARMSRIIRRLLLAGVLLAVAYGGWQIYRSALFSAQRQVSRTNLKQIGLALHQYHDKYNTFPPAYVLGPDEKAWHSWRVLLLPFLGEEQLYAKYRFDEPWDGPHNRELLGLRPSVYWSRLGTNRKSDVTTYLAVVSRRTMWPAHFPVSVSDVTDGISNTIQLIENVDSNVVWSEPRDMRERDALKLLRTKDSPTTSSSESEKICILMGDGSVRSVSPFLNRQLFIALLTPRATELMVDDERWPKGLLGNETPTASKLPEVVGLDRFPGTRLLVAPEETIAANQTSLYSATVQIAWDELRPAAGAPVTTQETSPIITALNSHPFPTNALDPETYFAGVSGLDDQGSRDLLDRFRLKFPTAPVKLFDPKMDEDLRGDGLRVWSYMRKSMPFADVMDQFPDPLPFPAQQPQGHVQSFGWPSSVGEGGAFPVLVQTVAIRDYISGDEFIVSLRTESLQGDEIILAKIIPDANLRMTWELVAARLRQPRGSQVLEHLRGIDQLQIPILSFGVQGTLNQLVGLPIPMPRHSERFIADAVQIIQFRLDEYGAELIADTQMLVGENGHGPTLDVKPLKPRHFIFDSPFLLAIRERNAEVPYFLAWIGNADLMEPAK